MTRALVRELPRHNFRSLREDRLLLIIALPKPDALATPQIDCRPDLHGDRSGKVPAEAGNSYRRGTQNIAHATGNIKALRSDRRAAGACSRQCWRWSAWPISPKFGEVLEQLQTGCLAFLRM